MSFIRHCAMCKDTGHASRILPWTLWKIVILNFQISKGGLNRSHPFMHVWPISWHHKQEKSGYLTSSLLYLLIKLIYARKTLRTLPYAHFPITGRSSLVLERELFCYRLIRVKWWNVQVPALRLWSQASVGRQAGSLAVMPWLWVKLSFGFKFWTLVASSTKPIWFEDKL